MRVWGRRVELGLGFEEGGAARRRGSTDDREWRWPVVWPVMAEGEGGKDAVAVHFLHGKWGQLMNKSHHIITPKKCAYLCMCLQIFIGCMSCLT
jgi:hypothetical protein